MLSMNSPKMRRRVCAVGVVAASLALGGPASADDKKVAAQVLFDAAMKLTENQKYEEACPKLEESQKIDPQIGTLFWLADCQEHVGALASAWANFVDAADRARAAGRESHASEAQGRADKLKVRLIQLIVVVPDETKQMPGLKITRDGVELGAASYGLPTPVDPGKHLIRVSATGRRPWETSVTAAGEGNTMTVSIPVLTEEPSIQVVPTTTAAPTATPTVAAGSWPVSRSIAIGVGGVGLVGVGMGIGFGLDAIGNVNGAKPECDSSTPAVCSPKGGAMLDAAKVSGSISTVGFIAGGVLLAGGVALFLVAPGKASSKPTSSVWITPMSAGKDGAGVLVGGKL